jgi:hypothetical protein
VLSTGYDLDIEDLSVLEPASGKTVVLTKPWNEAEFAGAIEEVTSSVTSVAVAATAMSAGSV